MMLSTAGRVVVLAHPLTQRGELPVAPLVLAAGAVYVLVVAAAIGQRLFRPSAAEPPRAEVVRDTAPSSGVRQVVFWLTRAIGLALFLLAIATGRAGDTSQLRNITPALTIGTGWPLLTLAALVLGRVWWWVNPYDTMARVLSPLGAGEGVVPPADEGPEPVWWAIAPAAIWMFCLTVVPTALEPRFIGLALIVYTIVTLAGCLALGRRTWLVRAEFFTVFFGLLASFRTQGLRWNPPPGAAALLGVVAGGALFGVFRDSDLGIFIAFGVRANLYSRIAVVLFMAAAGYAAHRAARRATPGSIVVAMAPMTGALVLALAISRNRLTTSLQLLPIAASDPFGSGMDLFGTATNGLHPRPLGDVGPVWLQTGLLVLGAVAGMFLARRYAAQRSPAAGQFPINRTSGIVLSLLGTLLGIGVAAAAAI
jgi:hypothetical protein